MRGNAPKDPARLKISSILSSSLPAIGLDVRLKEYTIKKTWTECVGMAISKRAMPIRLIGTTLWCSVSSAPWMTELSFHKQSIIEKLNEALGAGSITDIVYRPGRVVERRSPERLAKKPFRTLTEDELRFIDAAVEPVKDEKLKELIMRVIGKAKSSD